MCTHTRSTALPMTDVIADIRHTAPVTPKSPRYSISMHPLPVHAPTLHAPPENAGVHGFCSPLDSQGLNGTHHVVSSVPHVVRYLPSNSNLGVRLIFRVLHFTFFRSTKCGTVTPHAVSSCTPVVRIVQCLPHNFQNLGQSFVIFATVHHALKSTKHTYATTLRVGLSQPTLQLENTKYLLSLFPQPSPTRSRQCRVSHEQTNKNGLRGGSSPSHAPLFYRREHSASGVTVPPSCRIPTPHRHHIGEDVKPRPFFPPGTTSEHNTLHSERQEHFTTRQQQIL
ncbi:unnamed protein product, partial [Ectocarpus sp. 12 AP-2014]